MYTTSAACFRRCTLIALLCLALPASLALAEKTDDTESTVIVVGGQDVDVDADQNRGAKFERNRDVPDGVVLDYFQWSRSWADNWVQLKA